jgi:hypothetical protein
MRTLKIPAAELFQGFVNFFSLHALGNDLQAKVLSHTDS